MTGGRQLDDSDAKTPYNIFSVSRQLRHAISFCDRPNFDKTQDHF